MLFQVNVQGVFAHKLVRAFCTCKRYIPFCEFRIKKMQVSFIVYVSPIACGSENVYNKAYICLILSLPSFALHHA